MEFLACDEVLQRLVDDGDLTAIVAIVLGCAVGMVGIVLGTIGGIVRTRAKEATRRELAAYIAEGTLKPEDAIAMLNAGKRD